MLLSISEYHTPYLAPFSQNASLTNGQTYRHTPARATGQTVKLSLVEKMFT